MNQPRRIQFTNGNVTEYVYTSTGEKLRTIHRTAAANTLSVDSTDYIGNFILRNGKADKYLFGGGYCTFTAAGQPVYHYYTRDHLGNNRAVVNENGTVEQVTHYYPFGGVYGDAGLNASLQPYKYNGKELDRTHELDLYDYGARNYDAIIGSWTTMDPLAERTPEVSPYVYCEDNPVNAIDIDGRKVVADSVSETNIVNTLSKKEAEYVQFDEKGVLNNSLLCKYTNSSTNFDALRTLSKSSINYVFKVSNNDYVEGDKTKPYIFFDKGQDKENPNNYRYGITRIPKGMDHPSPNNNVYIFTASFLSPKLQARNMAHEGYGHAYFYELSLSNPKINPNHILEKIGTFMEYDDYFKTYISVPVWSKTGNPLLENQIKQAELNAIQNYESRYGF
jgi:RHS repeat-associated protein